MHVAGLVGRQIGLAGFAGRQRQVDIGSVQLVWPVIEEKQMTRCR
jgi:hypothetical protein